VRVVATHHPLFGVVGLPRARPVRRFGQALDMLARQCVEMLMHGHLHQQYATMMHHAGQSFLTIGAPTALSSRVRGEPNGFWMIEISADCLVLTLYRLELGGGFAPTEPVKIPRDAATACAAPQAGPLN
jgi:hypothetical protein